MNFLETIIGKKRTVIEESKRVLSLADVRRLVAGTGPANDFRKAVTRPKGDRIRIIAEIKRASPSRGVIAGEIDPVSVSKEYKSGGASAISVLTENDFFHGSARDLQSVRDAVPTVPLLRKDFVIDEYQVYESVLIGADAILLIVAALERNLLRKLIETARSAAIVPLVEVHDADELDIALSLGADTVGVNNRDLATFNVSPEVSAELAAKMPPGVTSVSESGIKDIAGLDAAASMGYHAVLIGEHFMRAADREEEVSKFTRGVDG